MGRSLLRPFIAELIYQAYKLVKDSKDNHLQALEGNKEMIIKETDQRKLIRRQKGQELIAFMKQRIEQLENELPV